MARKHDNLFKYGGYRYAPEQWGFSYNGKPLKLDPDTKSTLAQMIISGKKKEAKDILKRLLRKEEKKLNDLVTYGFYGKDSMEFYFTQSITAHKGNLAEKLRAYKEWKRYITEECNGKLLLYEATTGYITPKGLEMEQKEDKSIIIDFNRPGCTVRLINESIFA